MIIREFFIKENPRSDQRCTKDIPVKFKIGEHFVSGFLDTDMIVKNSSSFMDCSKIEQMYFLNSSVIKRTGSKIVIVNNNTVVSHRTLLHMNSFNVSKNNFFHSKTITDGVDFA